MFRSLLISAMLLAVLMLSSTGCNNSEGEVPKADPQFTGKTGKQMIPKKPARKSPG